MRGEHKSFRTFKTYFYIIIVTHVTRSHYDLCTTELELFSVLNMDFLREHLRIILCFSAVNRCCVNKKEPSR